MWRPFAPQNLSESKWTYHGSLQYKFNEQSNVYVTYSTGFKSGVFNAYATTPQPTKPETVGSIEAGLKSEPFALASR